MMEPTDRSPQELSLSDYLDVAKRRKWTIVQTLAVVGVVGLVTTAMMTPVYRAQSKLLVQAASAQIKDGAGEPEIKVGSVRDTNVLQVTVESPDRKLASSVANTVLDEYQRQT